MSSSQNYVTQDMLLNTSYAMIAITSSIYVARAATRFWTKKPLMAEDYILLLAFVLFLSTTVMYIVVTPVMYKTSDVILGKTPPYPELLDDSLFMIKIFFANTMIFWFTLWYVNAPGPSEPTDVSKGRQIRLPCPLLPSHEWSEALHATLVGCCGLLRHCKKSRKSKNRLTDMSDIDRVRRVEFHIMPQHACLVYSRPLHHPSRRPRTGTTTFPTTS
jgi:hypothetical protein